MKFTNRFGLPDILLRAARRQQAKYNKGNVDRSVTQLIMPPRIDMLRKAHFAEMEKDLSDEWWALFGSAVHSILEENAAAHEVAEKRYFLEIDGWRFSGQCDLSIFDGEGVDLTDWKVTTSYAVMMNEDGAKAEWEQQLNMLAYLVFTETGINVSGLAVVAIIRDWQRKQAQLDPLYPPAPVVRIPVAIWSRTKQRDFIHARIRIHRHAEMLADLGHELPFCTDEERWMRESSYAVMKNDNKRATRVFASEQNAAAFVDEQEQKIPKTKKKNKDTYQVVMRPGESVRCKGNYCGVAEWCSQWALIKEHENAESNDDGDAVEQKEAEEA